LIHSGSDAAQSSSASVAATHKPTGSPSFLIHRP
jgi:hypothetical protein